MCKPLLSIVVPTKDRYKYLKYLIDYIIDLNNSQIEFVIQDNTSDNKEILEFLSDRTCSNIKYFHYKEPISVCENSDKAVLNSTGEYVCYIGDDDAFLPSIMEMVSKIILNSSEGAVFPRPEYFWPDIDNISDYYNHKKKDQFFINRPTGVIFEINGPSELNNCLQQGGGLLNMPKLYHGIIKRSLLDRVYEKFGTFFPGPSPDMANAVALSLLAKKIIFIDYPVIISGTGKKRIENNEQGDFLPLEKAVFLPHDVQNQWNSRIPRVWTGPTIFAQTIYIVLNKFNHNIFDKFNWDKFYIRLGSIYPNLISEFLSKNLIYLIKIKALIYILRLKKRIISKGTKNLIKIEGENNTVQQFAINIDKQLKSIILHA